MTIYLINLEECLGIPLLDFMQWCVLSIFFCYNRRLEMCFILSPICYLMIVSILVIPKPAKSCRVCFNMNFKISRIFWVMNFPVIIYLFHPIPIISPHTVFWVFLRSILIILIPRRKLLFNIISFYFLKEKTSFKRKIVGN